MTDAAPLSLAPAMPAAAAAVGALLILALDTAAGRARMESRGARRRGLVLALAGTLALLTAVLSGLVHLFPGASTAAASVPAQLRMDGLAAASVVIVGVSGVLAIWLSSTYLMVLRLHAGEYFVLLLLSIAGAFVAVAAGHLLVLYVGLELMVLPAHVLAGFDRTRRRSNEAALKSFLLGAFGSALLLFGLALTFGATGHLDHASVRAGLADGGALGLMGIALVVAGVGVKAGIAPFHQWAPDVDEGAPTSVTAFVSVCVRGAALLVLLRVVVDVFPADDAVLRPVFAGLAIIGIAIGSLMAMVQRNVKRLIAWAGIAHTGTMLLAFVADDAAAYGAMLFYLIAVSVATLGALGMVLTLAGGGREVERLEDFAGIGKARPGLAALMTLFLIALAGLPVTAGFWAKLLLLRAVVDAGHVGLAIVALIGSVVALYAYMRVPAMMFMRDAPDQEIAEPSTSELAVLLLCAVVIVYLGVVPDPRLPGFAHGLLELLGRLVVGPA